MSNIFQPLLFLIARSTHAQLARQLEFAKAENRMLRRRVPKKRIFLTDKEKAQLLKLGQAIGPGVRHLITVVSYSAYRCWVRAADKDSPPAKKRGRPRTAEEIRDLILKLAGETGWGYGHIMGELKKLGIKPPSRSTIKNILKENGFDPGPKRGKGSWDEFIKIHVETLWQIDFFSKHI